MLLTPTIHTLAHSGSSIVETYHNAVVEVSWSKAVGLLVKSHKPISQTASGLQRQQAKPSVVAKCTALPQAILLVSITRHHNHAAGNVRG